MFEVTVTNNRASTKRGELLTEGQVGAKVHFSFNDHWTNMKKTAVFKRCGKTIVLTDTEWDGETAPVPPEMTEKAGQLVHVGVYGVSEDGKQITPTLYAPLGVIAKGANPDGDPSTDPTLPVWAQIQRELTGVKKDLTDVAAKAVQADWSQNDPEQPDYVKNRTHSADPKYVFAGNTFTEWVELTQYAQRPIPKVVVQGVEYFNVNVTKIENPQTAETTYNYQLSDTVRVKVYLRQLYIAPKMDMYSYDPGIHEIAPDYIPQHVDWIEGNTATGAYISNRPGGYIEPSDTDIGAIIRVGQGTVWPAYADRLTWKSTKPKDTDAVRIAGMYVDGTFFDACCLYGALATAPDVKQYGSNPFRFKMTDRTDTFITRDVVSYATIYSATLHKHPDWTLPRLGDADNPNWGLAPRASSRVSNDHIGWTGLGQDSKGQFYSEKAIRVIPELKSMTELMAGIGILYQINSEAIIGELLENALGCNIVFPPFRVFTRKVPDSSGTTFGFDIEDVDGNWVYMVFSPDSPDKPQSVNVIRRSFYNLDVTVDLESGRATTTVSPSDLEDAADTSRRPVTVLLGDQSTWQIFYEGNLPVGFIYVKLDADTKKMRQYLFFMSSDKTSDTVAYSVEAYIDLNSTMIPPP